MKTIFVFDLGGVLIKLNVARCMRAFEALMGEQNMRAVLGMDSNGEGVKAVSIASKQLMVDFEKGLISTDKFLSEVQTYCRPGTTRQEIIDAWMTMLDELPAERLQVVDDLRAKGHRVYLLSNSCPRKCTSPNPNRRSLKLYKRPSIKNQQAKINNHTSFLLMTYRQIAMLPSKRFIGKPSKASMRCA